jgi:tryptophan 2,3-dioxygenase
MNQNNPEILALLGKLEEKYQKSGQDLKAYLEGLLHADYLNYWDYIQVDTLLSLQKPRTDIKDEAIFIMYHQITELYFKLTLHEMAQIAEQKGTITVETFATKLKRMTAYFGNLRHSFEIMVDGMDKNQFLQFRMSLLPASGFQSAQYRMVEICATDFYNLVDREHRNHIKPTDPFESQYEFIYWKAGATELATGKKTLTLTQFEERYSERFKHLAAEYKDSNIWAVYKSLSETDQQNPTIIKELRAFDELVNVHWPLMHYKSAARYLQRKPEDIAATGGTNWQKYLPPRFQKRIFYPELWSAEEIENWGRAAFIDPEPENKSL